MPICRTRQRTNKLTIVGPGGTGGLSSLFGVTRLDHGGFIYTIYLSETLCRSQGRNPSYSGVYARTEGLIIDHIHHQVSSKELTSRTFEASQVKNNKTPKSTEAPPPHWAGQDAAQILGKVERIRTHQILGKEDGRRQVETNSPVQDIVWRQ